MDADCAFNIWEWLDLVGRARLGSPAKSVAPYLAKHADRDGTHCHPGVALLVVYTERDWKTVTLGLRVLREAGLIELVKSGRGRSSVEADEYRLVLPQQQELGYLGEVPCPMPEEVRAMAVQVRARRRGKAQGVVEHPLSEPSPVDNLPSFPEPLGAEEHPQTVPLGTSDDGIGGGIPPHTYPPTYPNNQKQLVEEAVTVLTRERPTVDNRIGHSPAAKEFTPPLRRTNTPPPAPGRCSAHPWVRLDARDGCGHCAREQATERAGGPYLRVVGGA